MNEKRIYSYDFIKLVGLFFIILHHSCLVEGILVHGYIFVELFFLVAGFLLCMRFERKKESVPKHFAHRWMSIWSKYFLVLIIYFFAILIGKHEMPYNNFEAVFGDVILFQALGTPIHGGV